MLRLSPQTQQMNGHMCLFDGKSYYVSVNSLELHYPYTYIIHVREKIGFYRCYPQFRPAHFARAR